MQFYEVRISHAALVDMANLRTFLNAMLSEEGAIRYANNMRAEIKLLSVYADCFRRTTSKTLLIIFIPRLAGWFRITAVGYMFSILKDVLLLLTASFLLR